ncbi:MAG: TIR domain-containing protein [Synechococcaceae cyanobacterium]|nr:TIR domain-containing protein [Synechococcaceae cyanobacterium]
MAGPRSTHYSYDVFLSHSSADKPVVRELAERLKAAGLRVWFDSWQIRPGDHISTAIEAGLEHAAVLLFCMSANAFGSDWAQLESHTAIFRDPLNRDRRFVPLRLDDAPIKAMLRGYAYLDWRPSADRGAEWGRLLEACGGGEALRDGSGLSSAAPEPAADEEQSSSESALAAPKEPLPPRRPTQAASAAAALSPQLAAAATPGPKVPLEQAAPSPEHPASAAGAAAPALQPSRALDLFHPGGVNSVGWSADGERLASGGDDGTVRLWEASSGKELAVLEGHKGGVMSVGWDSEGAVWASRQFGLVMLWPANLLPTPGDTGSEGPSRTYTNAKVLVVGESGAGKTGLTRRLATGSFAESGASTIGAWCTQWPLPQPAPAGAAAADPPREIWLWDFGGQADQRLIHQLFLDRAALVLLLFNAESDQVIDGLRDWQTALRRSLAEPPPQLLVAARTDAGFGASRALLQRFASENNCHFLETSARTGAGCPELTAAITETIPWDQLPRHTSPLLFQQLKAAILTLRDQGTTLLTFKNLRERLLRSFPNLDDATLRTVLGLLDGPGVLKQLDFGDFVLLKPEWLGVYGQAVVRALKQAEPQLGALHVGAISAADLPFADQPRLEHPEEPLLLAELERQLQERKICLRQGGRLVFPSFCGRERPASPALPPRFMSYAVRGWLDEIHASLVVSLEETRVFQLREIWRDAAEFRTVASAGLPSGRALAVQLQRNNASEGTITVHTAAGLSLTEQAQFAQLIHGHLHEAADSVERRRHWLCPHCHTPKGNEEVLMKRLERDGETARVVCDACDRSIPLFDDLERLLADPLLRRQAESLGVETPQLTSRRKGKLLMLEVGARLTSANQKWQEINPDEDDGIDLQVEFTDDDGNGTGRYLFLQLKAGPSHLRRRADGREMFAIKKPRWIRTWTQQPGPVMLVIGREAPKLGKEDRMEKQRRQFAEPFDDRYETRAFPDVRWMEISSVLQQQMVSGLRPEDIKQIEFLGETLDLASVLRWRRRILAENNNPSA